MSTWISKAVFAGWLCAGVVMAPALAVLAEVPALPKKIVLRVDDITVQGPEGYCPDPSTLTQPDGAASVLLGRCSDRGTVHPAVISVTFGKAGSAAAMAAGGAEMAAFFATDAGRKSLSRRGRAADVSVTSARSLGDLFLFRVVDKGEGIYWRAMTTVGARTVLVKASGPELSDSESRKLVEATAKALRRANR